MKNRKNIIKRENEINVIAYEIPNTNDFILGRTYKREWVVNTRDGVVIYNTSEMEEIYKLDLVESNFKRLTFTA